MKRTSILSIGYALSLVLAPLAADDGQPPTGGTWQGDEEKKTYQLLPIKFVCAESVALVFGGLAVDMLPADWVSRRTEDEPPAALNRGGLVVPEGIDSIVALRQRNAVLVYGTPTAFAELKALIEMLDQPMSVVALDLLLVVGERQAIPQSIRLDKEDLSVPRTEGDWNAAWEELKRFPSSSVWQVCLNTTIQTLNSARTSASADLLRDKRWAELSVTPLLEAEGGVNLRTTLALQQGHGDLQTVLKAQNRQIVSLCGVRVDERRELMLFLRPRILTPTNTR